MDLRKLTLQRIEELIDINERKQKTWYQVDNEFMNDLIRVRTKLENARNWKLQNA